MGLAVEQKRGDTVETLHRVSAAVVSDDGRLRASSGSSELVTFMRSAAKPLQAITLLESGAAGQVDITEKELALACASHNSEVGQVEIAAQFLKKLNLSEQDLACGPHRSLFYDLGRYQGNGVPKPELVEPSPLGNNCSGKHSAMLAFAQCQGWDVRGYEKADHPVQQAHLAEISLFSDMNPADIETAVDGCGVVTFAMPLKNMAVTYARLVARDDEYRREIVDAMVNNPGLIAGSHRLCTAVMEAYPGKIIAKVGAGGVYLAGLIDKGLGVALKVEDGDARAAEVALLAVLRDLGLDPDPVERLPLFGAQKVVNTRAEVVGAYGASGRLDVR